MFRTSPIRLLLIIIVSIPTAAISVWSVTRTFSQMFDPCVRWDAGGGASGYAGSVSIGPDDPCKSRTVIGESKIRAALVSILVPGVVLVSAILATIGVALSRRWMIYAAATLMLAETPAVFSIGPLTLITGLLYLLCANRTPRALLLHPD